MQFFCRTLSASEDLDDDNGDDVEEDDGLAQALFYKKGRAREGAKKSQDEKPISQRRLPMI